MKNTTSLARITLATTFLLGTAAGYAATPAPQAPMGPSAASAIAAAETLSNNLMFQYDPNLPQLISSNLGNAAGQEQVPQTTANQTQTDANNILSQIMYSMYPSLATNSNNSPSTILQNLTVNAPGPDSLMLLNSNQQPVNVDSNGDTSSANTSTNPSFMSIGSVINTPALNSTGLSNAQNFVNLVTDAYEPVVNNQTINYSGLGQALNSKSLTQKQKIAKLQAIQNNPDYQKFQAGVRAQVAEKSVALNIFNSLIAERTPVSGLGANIPTLNNDASPLQVEHYLATTARVDNPTWYQSMQSASPATVQRETLYVLAEIENQLYQLHMDNEQALTALATLVLQQASAEKMLQQTSSMSASNVVNQQITGAKNQQAQVSANDRSQAEQEQQAQEAQQRAQENNGNHSNSNNPNNYNPNNYNNPSNSENGSTQ